MIGKKFKTACELRFPSQDLLNKCGDKLKYLEIITSVILPKDTTLTVVDYDKIKNKYIFQINFIGEIISYNYKEFLYSKQKKDFLYKSDLHHLFKKSIVKGKNSFLLDMHNINRYKDSEAGNTFYQYLNSLNKTKFDWDILFDNKELNFIDSDYFYEFIFILFAIDMSNCNISRFYDRTINQKQVKNNDCSKCLYIQNYEWIIEEQRLIKLKTEDNDKYSDEFRNDVEYLSYKIDKEFYKKHKDYLCCALNFFKYKEYFESCIDKISKNNEYCYYDYDLFQIAKQIHNLILELPKLYISDLYYNIETKDTENIWTYLDEINN